MRTFFFCFVIVSSMQVAWCLRNVSLLVLPPAVQKGHHAALLCLYDLENAPLYSVKWYRGNHEFYRYSPTDTPPNKIFPFDGIHVDLSMSNATQVMLQNVQFKLSGNISCEVSADSPSFSTAIVSRHLMVVDLPDSGPEIHTEKERYEAGDVLNANCTSPPSKPPASLSFLLNNHPVGKPETQKIPGPDLLQSSSLSLTVQLLPSHFNNGQLILKCTALVTTLYRESAEVHLGVSPREPIPERVTSPNMASHTSTATVHLVLLLVALYSGR
uniref:Ig-like domain-containing protein n=1 Tax=Graphocephala atropunctata TaxID=36148 RepID=A0A1B6M6F8_9HEMI